MECTGIVAQIDVWSGSRGQQRDAGCRIVLEFAHSGDTADS
jgi:hypothetical protein